MRFTRALTCGVIALLTMVTAIGPALASACGCSSAILTQNALSAAQMLSPVAWEQSGVQRSQQKLELLLLDYDTAFLVDYKAMTHDQRVAHYEHLNELRLQRIADVNDVADAYAAAGADQRVLDVLHGHAAMLNVQTEQAVAVLKDTPQLLDEALRNGDAYALQAVVYVKEACNELRQPNIAACVADAVANSDKYSEGHLTKFAWVSGPMQMLDQRMIQLRNGAKPMTSA